MPIIAFDPTWFHTPRTNRIAVTSNIVKHLIIMMIHQNIQIKVYR